MTAKKIAGLSLVSVPFLVLYLSIGLLSGWDVAFFIFLFSSAVAGITYLGIKLLSDE